MISEQNVLETTWKCLCSDSDRAWEEKLCPSGSWEEVVSFVRSLLSVPGSCTPNSSSPITFNSFHLIIIRSEPCYQRRCVQAVLGRCGFRTKPGEQEMTWGRSGSRARIWPMFLMCSALEDRGLLFPAVRTRDSLQ